MEENRYKTFAACSRFEAGLEAYLEGETNPFIDAHSHDCASCAAVLADLQSISQAARQLPQAEPSRAVWANIRASLEAEGAFGVAACSQFDVEIEAYLEGDANPFVASHSSECAACGAVLADLQAIREAARSLPEHEPSRALWTNVHSILAAEGILGAPACSRFEAELVAYMEGEANPFVVSHSSECAPCGALCLADLQAIRDAARSLPQEEPSRVVWANVRAQLEAEGTFGQRVGGWRQILGWRLVPQLVPLGVLAALVFLGSALTLPSSSIQQWGSADIASNSPVVARLASVIPAGQDGALASVVSELESSFKANESSMAPDLKATYEKSLVSLDGSIKECLDSLQQEPRNTLAHDYLVTAYTRKAEVLSSALEFNGR